jgi:hypothetical protein
MFLIGTFLCPAADRWEIAATTAEQDAGIEAMGMIGFSDPFLRAMIGQIVTERRIYLLRRKQIHAMPPRAVWSGIDGSGTVSNVNMKSKSIVRLIV